MSNEQLLKQVRDCIEYLRSTSDNAEWEQRTLNFCALYGAEINLALRFMEKMLGEPSSGMMFCPTSPDGIMPPSEQDVVKAWTNQALKEIKELEE